MNRTLRTLALPAIAAVLLAGCGGNSAEAVTEPAPAATPTTPPLEAVAEPCELPDSAIGDDGSTLILDGEGEDDRKLVGGKLVTVGDKLAIEDIACVLGGIGTPDFVVSMIEGTRAMDGRQSQDADGYSYTWTYHPDNGLDIIITEGA